MKKTALVRIETISGGHNRITGQPTGNVFFQFVATWTERSGKIKEERGNKYLDRADAVADVQKWSRVQSRPVVFATEAQS